MSGNYDRPNVDVTIYHVMTNREHYIIYSFSPCCATSEQKRHPNEPGGREKRHRVKLLEEILFCLLLGLLETRR
jgi:hypothetical protein